MSKFSEVMSNESDEKLIRIVTILKEDYQNEAVEAAQEEVKKRNLSISEITSLSEKIKSDDYIENENKSRKKPSLFHMILFLFFGFILIPLLPYILLFKFDPYVGMKKNGYHRKYKVAWRMTWIGAIIPIVIFILFSI